MFSKTEGTIYESDHVKLHHLAVNVRTFKRIYLFTFKYCKTALNRCPFRIYVMPVLVEFNIIEYFVTNFFSSINFALYVHLALVTP